MLITLLLAVSGILIGAGLTLVVRDWLYERRISFLSGLPQIYGRDRTDEADVGVRRGAENPRPPPPLSATGGPTPPAPSRPPPTPPFVGAQGAARPAAPSQKPSVPAPSPAATTPAARPAPEPRIGETDAGTRDAWNLAAPTLALALKAINGAFARAGAHLVETSRQPVWDASRQGYRLDIDVDVASETAARLVVVVTRQTLEIATFPAEAGRGTLAREQALPLPGLTVPRLAEAMAGCAWPSVAAHGGQRRA